MNPIGFKKDPLFGENALLNEIPVEMTIPTFSYNEVSILDPVPEPKKVDEGIRLIFVGQSKPQAKYKTHFKVEVPEELEKRIINNLDMFYQGKPLKTTIKITVEVEHDS